MKYLKLYENAVQIPLQNYLDFKYGKDVDLSTITELNCDNLDIVNLNGIENCINLEYFSCAGNRKINIKGIENCVNLERLYCTVTDLNSQELIYIMDLIKLKKLGLGGNNLENLEGVEKLINLTDIYVWNNNLKDLKELKNLINLKTIYCEHNNLINLNDIINLLNINYVSSGDNPWEYPIPIRFLNESTYTSGQINRFKTYELQKDFLTKYPERADDLKPFGFHEKIREEFPDLVEGIEFGFFGLK